MLTHVTLVPDQSFILLYSTPLYEYTSSLVTHFPFERLSLFFYYYKHKMLLIILLLDYTYIINLINNLITHLRQFQV